MVEHKYFSNLTSFVYVLMPFLVRWIVIAPNQRKKTPRSTLKIQDPHEKMHLIQ
jgi:hypothetical protein